VRKLAVVEYVSLDGVIQAPGRVGEDPEGGFAHGGWTGGFMAEHRALQQPAVPHRQCVPARAAAARRLLSSTAWWTTATNDDWSAIRLSVFTWQTSNSEIARLRDAGGHGLTYQVPGRTG
jgi:hypothetical protein